MLTVNFYLKNTANKSGERRLYVQITGVAPGARWRFTLPESIEERYWDAGKQLVKRSHPDYLAINTFLQGLRQNVHSVVRDMLSSTQSANLIDIQEAVRNIFEVNPAAQSKEAPDNLHKAYEAYISIIHSRVSQGYIYRVLRGQRYLLAIDPEKKLRVVEVNAGVMQKIQQHLLLEGQSNNTVYKSLQIIRTFLKWCEDNGFSVADNYHKTRIKQYEATVVWLEEDELQRLEALEVSPNWQAVKDFFLLGVYTGQRYSALIEFRHADLKGNVWTLNDKKTRRIIQVPLSNKAMAVVEKYRDQGRLKKLTNQYLNRTLKDICRAAEIVAPVTTTKYSGARKIQETLEKWQKVGVHTARHTFVTLSLERGVSPQALSHITHESYKVMMLYAHKSKKSAQAEVLAAWNEG